jgi:hypothetical protein
MPAPTPLPEDSAQVTAAAGAGTSRPAPRALVAPMSRILRIGTIAVLGALPVATLLGYLLAGAPGAWGALIGMGIAVAFFAVTVIVALVTARTRRTSMLGLAVVASWVLKVAVLIGILMALRGADFYSRPALFISLLVGTIGTLVIEARVVATTQVPYVETDQR